MHNNVLLSLKVCITRFLNDIQVHLKHYQCKSLYHTEPKKKRLPICHGNGL